MGHLLNRQSDECTAWSAADPERGRLDQLDRRNAELEALIERWERVDDPGSKWLLHLLRQALAIGRNRQRRLDSGEH